MNSGMLIVVSAPSGGGKGTILKELLALNKNLRYSVSATTRNPREGEQDGVHYRFITREAFQSMADAGQMLEYAEYCGNLYGTPKESTIAALNEGADILLEIEVNGGGQIKKLMPQCVSIFICPPSMKVLEQRLRDRGTEDESTLQKRLQTAKEELKCAPQYDYIVINDTVQKAVEEITEIINAEQKRSSRNIETIERIIKSC